jgi:hypothetical protein
MSRNTVRQDKIFMKNTNTMANNAAFMQLSDCSSKKLPIDPFTRYIKSVLMLHWCILLRLKYWSILSKMMLNFHSLQWTWRMVITCWWQWHKLWVLPFARKGSGRHYEWPDSVCFLLNLSHSSGGKFLRNRKYSSWFCTVCFRSFMFFNPEPVKIIPRLLEHVKKPEKVASPVS